MPQKMSLPPLNSPITPVKAQKEATDRVDMPKRRPASFRSRAKSGRSTLLGKPDRYLDRRGIRGDRRGPGQENGLDNRKSRPSEMVTGLTGSFQSIRAIYSGGSLMPLLVSLLASCGFHALRALRESLIAASKAVEAAELVF